jgi:hypothetical protein
MASNIEILKRGGQPETETGLETVKRRGAMLGLGALEGVENIAALIPKAIGYAQGRNIPIDRFSEQIKREKGLSDEYLEPRNFAESVAQKFSGKAPAAALFGPAALAAAGGASLVGAGLKKLGLPEWAQDVAEFGTDVALGFGTGRLKTPSAVQKAGYDTAKSSVPKNLKVSAKPIIDSWYEVGEKLDTEASAKVAGKVEFALNKISKLLGKGDKLNPAQIIDLRSSINQVGSEINKLDAAKYIQPLKDGMNDFFASYGATNPKFFDSLSKADQLTTMKHMGSYVDKFGNWFGGLGMVAKPIQWLATKTLGKGESFLKSIVKLPEARKYYLNTIAAGITQDPNLFLKNITGLKNEVEKVEHGPKIEIVKRGKR